MYAPKLLTRNFLIISLVNLFVYFAYYLLIAIIAVYASDKFHASPSAAGLSAGIFIIGAVAGRLYGGSSIERIGHKKMLYLGLALYLVTTLLYSVVFSIWTLIAIRLFHGAAFGLASTATGTISAEIIPSERRGEGTGYYALSMTIATAIGPFIGMFLISRANFGITIIVCSIALGVSLLVAVPLTVPNVSLVNCEEGNSERFKPSNFFEIKALPISVVTSLICFGYSSVLAFISSYTKSINLIEAGSFFYIAYAAAILVSRPIIGRWFDRKGENFVTYPTILLFAFALVMLGEANHGYSILLAGVLMGFGYGNFFAIGQALVIKASPQNRRALATSTYFIFADVGFGIGPFFLGFLVPFLDYRGLYLIMAIFVIVTSFIYYLIYGRKCKRKIIIK